jgi:hypothetical protein
MALCAEQRLKLGRHLRQDMLRHASGAQGLPGTPIEASELIDQDDARHAVNALQRNLEGIAFGAARDRTRQGKPDAPIVPGR